MTSHFIFRTAAAVFAAALISAPAFAETIVVYSPQGGDERGVFIAARAKEATGHDVKFLAAGGGELLDRIMAEKANPQADVVLGLVPQAMYRLKGEGVFLAHVPSWAGGLDPVFKDKDGQFHMFWQTPIVVAYAADKMAGLPAPKSWLDLAKPAYKDKFTVGPIAAQTTRVYIAGILSRFADPATGVVSEQGWSTLKAFYANARPTVEGVDAWRDVAGGATPVVISWFGGVVNNAAKNNIAMTYVDTDGGTPIVAESVGIMAGTRKIEASKAFVEWFGSPAFMAEYAAKFNQTPAHPEAIAKSPAQVQANAKLFRAQNLDWALVARNLDGWLKKVQLEIIP